MRYILLAFCVLMALTRSGHAASEAEEGKQIYHAFCVPCHGPNMVKARGPVADLRKFPLDQRERFVRSVAEGKKSMPAWGDRFSETDLEALWTYVKTRGK